MPCIERSLRAGLVLATVCLLAACAQRVPLPPTAPAQPAPQAPPAQPVPHAPPAPQVPSAPVPAPAPWQPTPPPPAPRPAAPAVGAPATGASPTARARRVLPLAPPAAARSWDEFKLQAATRLVQAHPDGSYTGTVPEPLLAIPVIEVEFNADGSVRRVNVMRQPGQARDTVQLAIDAIHAAAPYGSMARLPLPWKWSAVFLFDDQRRFKPRELDR